MKPGLSSHCAIYEAAIESLREFSKLKAWPTLQDSTRLVKDFDESLFQIMLWRPTSVCSDF